MTRIELARLLWVVLEGPKIDSEADALHRAGAGGVHRPTILVALRNPYDLAVLRAVAEGIAAHADVPATLRALSEALTGRAGLPGSLGARLTVPAEVA